MNWLAERLSIARDEVAKGWCRGGDCARVLTGPVCAMAACDRAGIWAEGRAALMAVLRVDSVIIWNDDPHRSQDDVLAAFDLAIRHVSDGAPSRHDKQQAVIDALKASLTAAEFSADLASPPMKRAAGTKNPVKSE